MPLVIPHCVLWFIMGAMTAVDQIQLVSAISCVVVASKVERAISDYVTVFTTYKYNVIYSKLLYFGRL